MTDLLPAAEPRTDAPLSVRAVDKVATLLAGRGSTRRRFLYRLAVVGSAMAIDPLRFITRPTPAYASVCGSGNQCDDGWSVFCCTINNGANTCPDGSFVAGWWKVDASAFCLGSPRYYIDCNRTPGESCNCRCNSTGCDNRRVCCNVFRYGQCNTQIGGVTEVVCRLITCTPPWRWDPNCGRTVRTDNETRSHSSRCLPGTNPTRIEIKYQDLGLRGSVLGAPEGREVDAANNGRKRRYDRGYIFWHRNTGAHEVHGAISKRHQAFHAAGGVLGYPKTDQRAVGDGQGFYNRFERGSIYWLPGSAARAVLARADERYRLLGGPRGDLGYPTSDTQGDDGAGRVTNFQRGAIYMSPDTNAVEVQGAILGVYRARGGPGGSTLGYPVRPRELFADGGRLQQFRRGLIAGPSSTLVYAVRRQIAGRYKRLGGVEGPWGYPAGHTNPVEGAERGLYSRFEHVTAYWSELTGTRWLNGEIRRHYLAEESGPAGRLGYPVTDVEELEGGNQRAQFEHGEIIWDTTTGAQTFMYPA